MSDDSITLGVDLETGEGFRIRVHPLITGRTAVVAKTGFGKSWTIRRIVEGLLDLGYPVGILDPEGEHVSLADHYEILLISPQGDVDPTKVPPARLAKVARKGVSFVLDLSSLKPEEVASTVPPLLEGLMEHGDGSGFLLVVDEAKELAPERGASSVLREHARRTATWLEAVATRGRKRGLGLLFSTQRPQLISKTLLSQAENKIILRIEYSRDLKAIAEYLGISREMYSKIRTLERGVAYVDGPFVDKPGLVRIGEVKTKHLGGTPLAKPRPPPSMRDVISYLLAPEMTGGVEAAKAEESGEVEVGEEIETVEIPKELSLDLSDLLDLPPKELRSRTVRSLLRARGEIRSLIKELESRRTAMNPAVYELLREEYQKRLDRIEQRLSPYVETARQSVLLLEAAYEDRRNRLSALEKAKGLGGRIRYLLHYLPLNFEMRTISKRLERARKILRDLEG